jgi:transposase, IS5 family
VFSARLGRPSVPVQTLLRLLYLKHRYQLGYQSLCQEVADSIGWRRFARIPLDQPVPHPTTLVKLVGRAGPKVLDQLNAALLAKLAGEKVLRCRKLRIDTTVIAADIDHPTDADLLEHAVRTLGGLVRRIHGRGAATRTAFRDRSRSAGRRLKQISRTLRRRTGQAPVEIDRLTAQVAAIARRALTQAERVGRNARRARAKRSRDGRLRRLVERLEEATAATRRLLEQTRQRLAGDRVIPDRLVSLADPDARPIRKGKPGRPTEFGYTVLLAECERGFIATHHTHKGNPGDAAQLIPAVQDVIAVTGRPPGTVVGIAGWAPPPTTPPLPRWGPADWAGPHGHAQQGQGLLRADQTVQADAQLAGRDRGPHQPAQALVRAGSYAAASPGRRAGLGWAGDLRLQPAADDGGHPVTTATPVAPPTRQPHQDFFRGK